MINSGENIQGTTPVPQATPPMQTIQEEVEKKQKSPLSKAVIIIFGFFVLLVVSEIGYLAYTISDRNKHLLSLAGEQEQQVNILKKYIDENQFNLFTKCPFCDPPKQFTKPLNVQKGELFFAFMKEFGNKTEFIEKANIEFTLSGYVVASEPEESEKNGNKTVWKFALIPENVARDDQIVIYRFTQKELDNTKPILINTGDRQEIPIQEIPIGTYVQINSKLNLLDSTESYEILLTVW